MQTHYDNLKVSRRAPPEVIKAAYKVLTQKYHPDRYPDKVRAEAVMKIVNRAYEVLSDPVTRLEHDQWIEGEEREAAKRTTTSDGYSSYGPTGSDRMRSAYGADIPPSQSDSNWQKANQTSRPAPPPPAQHQAAPPPADANPVLTVSSNVAVNYMGGARRVWAVLVTLQCLITGGIVLALWSESGPAGPAKSLLMPCFGAAGGALFASIKLAEELGKDPNGVKFEALLMCLLPVAATIAFFIYFAGALSVSGGWSPAFSGIFTNWFAAAFFTFVGTLVVLAIPLLPFGLLAWVANGFRSK